MLEAYKRAAKVLAQKPFLLWGLSLLSGLMMVLGVLLSFPLLIVGAAFGYVIEAGMSKVYLDGLRGKTVNSDQLFAGFKDFWRVLGGMAWAELWVLIWALIPIAGIVIAIVKAYSYRFVPYILMTRPDVSATQALRLSMKMTDGKKGQMFGADVVFSVGASLVFSILTALMKIPVVGVIIGIITLVLAIVYALFGGIFVGLYSAHFYDVAEAELDAGKLDAPDFGDAE